MSSPRCAARPGIGAVCLSADGGTPSHKGWRFNAFCAHPSCCCVSVNTRSTLALAKQFDSIGLDDALARQMKDALNPERVP